MSVVINPMSTSTPLLGNPSFDSGYIKILQYSSLCITYSSISTDPLYYVLYWSNDGITNSFTEVTSPPLDNYTKVYIVKFPYVKIILNNLIYNLTLRLQTLAYNTLIPDSIYLRTICNMNAVNESDASGFFGPSSHSANNENGSISSYFVSLALSGEINRIIIYQSINSVVNTTYTLYKDDIITGVTLTILAGGNIANWSGTYVTAFGDRYKIRFVNGPTTTHSVSATLVGIENF